MKAEQRATKFISLNVKSFLSNIVLSETINCGILLFKFELFPASFFFFCLFNTVIGIIKLIGSK